MHQRKLCSGCVFALSDRTFACNSCTCAVSYKNKTIFFKDVGSGLTAQMRRVNWVFAWRTYYRFLSCIKQRISWLIDQLYHLSLYPQKISWRQTKPKSIFCGKHRNLLPLASAHKMHAFHSLHQRNHWTMIKLNLANNKNLTANDTRWLGEVCILCLQKFIYAPATTVRTGKILESIQLTNDLT